MINACAISPTFKYLYGSEDIISSNISIYGNLIESKNDLSLLKDFNNFLTKYHRIPEKEVIDLFNNKISNEIKFLCVKAIIDSSIEEFTDEEVINYFGDLVYELIKDFCIDYEYPEDRASKYAKLYRDFYKNDISYFLSND
jgi:hypothetical protein